MSTLLERPPPKREEPIVIDDTSSVLSEPDNSSGPSSNLTPPPPIPLAPIFLKKPKASQPSASTSSKKPAAAPTVKKEKPKAEKRKAETEPKKVKKPKKAKVEPVKEASDIELDDAELERLLPIPRSVPEELSEDWQVPYIFAFITKFNVDIKGLFTITDLEEGLQATQPDDVLSEIIIVFLKNLENKSSPKLVKDNLPAYLTSFISSRLTLTSPMTVWDPFEWTSYVKKQFKKTYARYVAERQEPGFSIVNGNTNGKHAAADKVTENGFKGKGKADAVDMDDDIDMEGSEDSPLTAGSSLKGAHTSEIAQAKEARLALNPLQKKGLWELSWYEKSSLLRQLVEWQLVESEKIKGIVDENYPKKALRKEDNKLATEPIDRTSEGLRIWSFEPTYRLYSQTNPHHFSVKWAIKTDSKEEYEDLVKDLKSKVDGLATKAAKLEKLGKGAKRRALNKDVSGLKRDEKILKALEVRVPEILQYEIDTVEKQEKFVLQRERQRKAQEKRARLEAYVPTNLPTTRARARVNYGEQLADSESSDDEADLIPFNAPTRGRRGADEDEDYSRSASSEIKVQQPANRRASRSSRSDTRSDNSKQSYKAESDDESKDEAMDSAVASEDDAIQVTSSKAISRPRRIETDEDEEGEAEESGVESDYDNDS